LGKSHQTLIALEEILRSGKNVNTEIVKKIIDIGGIDAVPILLGALMDNNPDVYNAAAWGIQYPLMKIRGVNIDEDKLHKALIPATEYLISIIQGARISKGARSYDNRVAKAIGTLGAIGDTKSIPVLEQILSKIKINIKKYGNIHEYVNTGIAAGYISTQNDISHIETAIEEIKQREKLK
jgi:hypothetical protein